MKVADIALILRTLRDAIAQDADTLAWVEATYARGSHTVYIGIDPEDPPSGPDIDTDGSAIPDTGNYPIVSIAVTEKSGGYGADVISHTIEIVVGIYDDETDVSDTINVVEKSGAQRLEAFRKLVETATVTALHSLDLRVTGSLISNGKTEEFYPYFLCAQQYTAEEETEFGDDFMR